MNTIQKKKYDLVFGIGEACSCTQALRTAGLQLYSYPLDWLFGTDFDGRCQLVVSHFEHLIDKQDLVFCFENRSIKCNAYQNQKNKLVFNHDFLKDIPFDEMYELVKTKYDRRIERLLAQIKQAKSILVVYIETPIKDHPVVLNQDIIRAGKVLLDNLSSMGQPKQTVDLLYFHNTPGGGAPLKSMLTSHITKIEFDYKQHDADLDYIVNNAALVSALKNYELNIPLSYKLKKIFHKVLVCCNPSRSKRKYLRKKYHVN